MDEVSLKFREWGENPLLFCKEVLDFHPTEQQLEAVEQLRKLVRAKIRVGLKDLGKLKGNLESWERSYAQKMGISIMSGQGCGKTTWLAAMILWYITCFPSALIPCTAPKSDQLRDILWKEAGKIADRSKFKDHYIIQNDLIFLKDAKETNRAIARTALVNPGGESETLRGFHDKHMMICVDEATGVPDEVFKPLEGTLTEPCNFIVMISNATRTAGFAYNSHRGLDKDLWIRLKWNGEDSPLVSDVQVERMKRKYGENSNQYRIAVKGEFPIDSEDTLIPIAWVEKAIERGREVDPDEYKMYPIIVGQDCSGMGKDSSVIVVRQGAYIHEIKVFDGARDTTEQAFWLLRVMDEYDAIAGYVDVIGVGLGVYNQAKRQNSRVYAVNVANSARKEHYHRLRDELWFKGREWFQNNLFVISPDIDMYIVEDFKFQMSSPTFDGQRVDGKTKVESKISMKKRGISSPDMADALCLTMFRDDESYFMRQEDHHRFGDENKFDVEYNWMIG